MPPPLAAPALWLACLRRGAAAFPLRRDGFAAALSSSSGFFFAGCGVIRLSSPACMRFFLSMLFAWFLRGACNNFTGKRLIVLRPVAVYIMVLTGKPAAAPLCLR